MQHHKPILYTREATCDSYFNISNNLDIYVRKIAEQLQTGLLFC